MSGGSTEPEAPADRECPGCGQFYYGAGASWRSHVLSCGEVGDPAGVLGLSDTDDGPRDRRPNESFDADADAPSDASGAPSDALSATVDPVPVCDSCGHDALVPVKEFVADLPPGPEWYANAKQSLVNDYTHVCPNCSDHTTWEAHNLNHE